jgi:hypothetical protein
MNPAFMRLYDRFVPLETVKLEVKIMLICGWKNSIMLCGEFTKAARVDTRC